MTSFNQADLILYFTFEYHLAFPSPLGEGGRKGLKGLKIFSETEGLHKTSTKGKTSEIGYEHSFFVYFPL